MNAENGWPFQYVINGLNKLDLTEMYKYFNTDVLPPPVKATVFYWWLIHEGVFSSGKAQRVVREINVVNQAVNTDNFPFGKSSREKQKDQPKEIVIKKVKKEESDSDLLKRLQNNLGDSYLNVFLMNPGFHAYLFINPKLGIHVVNSWSMSQGGGISTRGVPRYENLANVYSMTAPRLTSRDRDVIYGLSFAGKDCQGIVFCWLG